MMAAQDVNGYQPVDTLYLWWTGNPARPVLIGQLGMVRATRGVSLRYAESWRATGFPLSEDLPLVDTEFLPMDKETAAGAVDDARPDRWGERVIRFLDKPPRLSLMEYLYFAGDERFGALGVSTSKDLYLPRRLGPLPELADVAQIDELVKNDKKARYKGLAKNAAQLHSLFALANLVLAKRALMPEAPQGTGAS